MPDTTELGGCPDPADSPVRVDFQHQEAQPSQNVIHLGHELAGLVIHSDPVVVLPSTGVTPGDVSLGPIRVHARQADIMTSRREVGSLAQLGRLKPSRDWWRNSAGHVSGAEECAATLPINSATRAPGIAGCLLERARARTPPHALDGQNHTQRHQCHGLEAKPNHPRPKIARSVFPI